MALSLSSVARLSSSRYVGTFPADENFYVIDLCFNFLLLICLFNGLTSSDSMIALGSTLYVWLPVSALDGLLDYITPCLFICLTIELTNFLGRVKGACLRTGDLSLAVLAEFNC